MSKIRTFIAIKIPPGILEKIADLQNNLKGIGGRISWTKPGNIHLTLKFLGDTDEKLVDDIATGLQQAVTGEKPFDVYIKTTGAFPNFNRPRVIWIGAESDGDELQRLAELVEGCTADFGFKKEKRTFSAHLTLGRVKDARGIEPVVNKLMHYKEVELGSFPVKDFHLIKSVLHSSGAIYTPLKTFILQDK